MHRKTCTALRKVRITRPASPWMKDLDISMLQRTRNAVRVKYKNDPSHRHYEQLKNIRNQLKKSIKETRRTFLKKFLLNKDCSETWKVINKILHPNPPTVKVNPDEVNNYTVPSEWKTSRICPIPKVKNPQSISDYRPISIKIHSVCELLLFSKSIFIT